MGYEVFAPVGIIVYQGSVGTGKQFLGLRDRKPIGMGKVFLNPLDASRGSVFPIPWTRHEHDLIEMGLDQIKDFVTPWVKLDVQPEVLSAKSDLMNPAGSRRGKYLGKGPP